MFSAFWTLVFKNRLNMIDYTMLQRLTYNLFMGFCESYLTLVWLLSDRSSRNQSVSLGTAYLMGETMTEQAGKSETYALMFCCHE